MNRKNILLVDDDTELCDELAEILRFEGYNVENTSDSSKGATYLEKNRYDIVILDFKMPNMTGFDLLKKIKTFSLKPVVLLISGRPFIEKMLEDEDLTGLVNSVITKPFDDKKLLDSLRSSL